jgi:hypothetical protein
MIHNKLQTATTLKRRGWHGSPLCYVCGRPEIVDHIMFQCVFPWYLWCYVRDPLGWKEFPTSLSEFMSNWLPRRIGVPERLVLLFFASFTWTIWKNRNKMAIEKALLV